MLKHVFLLDATRHIGLAQGLLDPAQAYTSQFQPEAVEWFVRPPQALGFRAAGADVHVVTAATAWAPIECRIREFAADGCTNRNFHVLSYEPGVVRAAGGINDPRFAMSALSLSTLISRAGRNPPTTNRATPPTIGSGNTPSLAEAIEITKRVLDKRGASNPDTAVKQSCLRGFLASEDSRLMLNHSDFGSRTLITDVVNDGIRNGWLERFRLDNKTGTERIYLSPSRTSARPVIIAAVPAPISNGTQTPGNKDPEIPARTDNKGRERTLEMINALKKRRIYTPKQIRDYIFSAIGSLMEQPNLIPLSASQLAREASSAAEKLAKADGVAFTFWFAASDASLEMMLRAGVLLDKSGQEIPPGVGARGAKVYSIAQDFEDQCETSLLEFLIKTLRNVTAHDRTALAHALFKVAPDKKSIFDMQDRVDELLMKLQNRVSESENGTLVLDKMSLTRAG